MRLSAIGSVLLATTLTTALAAADLPPSPGTKRVSFSFVVKGLSAAPERVLFAYPCSTSDGAPMAEYRKIDEGAAVSIGRRGGSCTMYSAAKSDFEAWLKTYKPQPPSSSDPAVEALAAKSVKCTGVPSQIHSLPEADPRSSVTETMTVTKLDATTCVLASAPEAATAGKAPSTGASGTSAAGAAGAAANGSGAPATTGAGPTGSGAAPKSSGCAASPSSGTDGSTGALAFGAFTALGLALVRRRRPLVR